MKVSERLGLNRQIADELANRYAWDEVDQFLTAFGLTTSISGSWDSDAEFYRLVLSRAPLNALAEIVEDLGLPAFSDAAPIRQLPRVWEATEDLRVFVSHLSAEKEKAARMRDCLSAHHMSAFVAHDDIEPTLEWQVQIERALTNCELFISMHTPGFSKSHWTQQEVGYAVGRGVKIIAVHMGEDPTGFIQKNQALSRGIKTAEVLSSEVAELVKSDERLKSRYAELNKVDQFGDLDDDIPF
ncbi:toll/interleukin-1 receptor domain-containing protein [Qipengyuania psychrotolerans]|uniref:Toll/interleukin-1 receptor domain-containing protein n=1 Tax=Qipengyuania psychrotolerans TaxID=2867238 RepID=A0ABX8ZDK7_9SPHN|nr:toll/interleukin-1 receptor domain-containing protein [Qipengyuania psychrotolerans]QZD86836.1 toll/interleukin-1 receptor domain-containing protein [Qipengyuania psychrotolerans]